MPVLRLGCLLALGLAGGIAFAQTLPSEPTQKLKTDADKPALTKNSDTAKQAIKKRVVEWLATCLKDWDRATHMTKMEWRTTCERVAAERGKFLLENPTVGSMFVGSTKDRQR